METSIFDFLHLLGLIQIRPNMDLGGGGVGICPYMPQYNFFPLFLPKKVEKGPQANTKVRGKKHIVVFFQFFSLVFSN